MKNYSQRRHNKYSFEDKKLALDSYLGNSEYTNVSLAEFSKISGVPYATIHGWGKAIGWDLQHIEELRRKPSPKKESGSGLEDGIETKILELKKRFSNWGPLKIKQYLWRHEQVLLPQNKIYKFLKERGLVNQKINEEVKKEGSGFEYPKPMAAVQMDLMSVTLTTGERIYLVTLLDDYSRFVLESQFVAVKTMSEVMKVFRQTIQTHGIMDHLLTDQGTEFVSWQKFTKFEEMLATLDIEYIASGPHKKENQGKVERWHKTIREELRKHGPLDTSLQAQLWIREVYTMYNYERPHQGIGGLVPADRFFGLREEIEAELERCKKEEVRNRKIYMVYRLGNKKIVLSGPSSEEAKFYVNGKEIREENS